MTEWRALTQGGIIAGSLDVGNSNGMYWTCPNGVTRIFAQYDHYIKVTPGYTYRLWGASYMGIGHYVPSASNLQTGNTYSWSMAGRSNIISWSNDISAHAAYEADADNYQWGDAASSGGGGSDSGSGG